MRILLSFLALLTFAGPSLTQTTGLIERQDGFWVQPIEGELPAGSEVQISSTGPVKVRGVDGRQVRYRIRARVKAGNEREARALFGEVRVRAERQGVTASLEVDEPGCRRCAFSAEIHLEAPRSTRMVRYPRRLGGRQQPGGPTQS